MKKKIRVRHKNTTGAKINIIAIFSELLKLAWFILKIPYYLIKFSLSILKEKKEKKEEFKIKKMRDSIQAIYQDFEIVASYSGNYSKWQKNLMRSDSKIGIILGARGKGKTALGVSMLENIYAQTKKHCFAMGFKSEDMPSWINVVDNIEDIKDNALVLIDEGGILFSSRKSMTNANQLLSELILIARHKNLSILFISQNSANLDVNILRQADYLILKPSSLLQIDFERKKIKELYEEAKNDFEKYKDLTGITYIYSDDFRGFVTNPLPSFWNVKISKSFK